MRKVFFLAKQEFCVVATVHIASRDGYACQTVTRNYSGYHLTEKKATEQFIQYSREEFGESSIVSLRSVKTVKV